MNLRISENAPAHIKQQLHSDTIAVEATDVLMENFRNLLKELESIARMDFVPSDEVNSPYEYTPSEGIYDWEQEINRLIRIINRYKGSLEDTVWMGIFTDLEYKLQELLQSILDRSREMVNNPDKLVDEFNRIVSILNGYYNDIASKIKASRDQI